MRARVFSARSQHYNFLPDEVAVAGVVRIKVAAVGKAGGPIGEAPTQEFTINQGAGVGCEVGYLVALKSY